MGYFILPCLLRIFPYLSRTVEKLRCFDLTGIGSYEYCSCSIWCVADVSPALICGICSSTFRGLSLVILALKGG